MSLIEHSTITKLAWMHIHFLWQGMVIALLYWGFVNVCAVASSRFRYLLGMTSLAAMLLVTAVTFAVIPADTPPPKNTIELTATPGITSVLADEGPIEIENSAVVPAMLETSLESHATITPQPTPSEVAPAGWTVTVIGIWAVGVMILGARLVGGLITLWWYRWTVLPCQDPNILKRFDDLAAVSGFQRSPRLAISRHAKDAFTFGVWRPLIVLPASWLMRLSPTTLEAVLAHELTHIRRWDAWANLFQRVVELCLFYHPAVWWLSRVIDREREKCCDAQAVTLLGNRIQYVTTLAEIAEFQREHSPATLSGPLLATGMRGKTMMLLERVKHVLGEVPRTGATSRFLAGALVLGVPAVLWVGTLMLPISAADGDGGLFAQVDGERERGERDGDRERGERERDVRRDGEREREGDRGDREREGEARRDGDRPRGEREGDFRREGDREREGDFRREGDRPRGDREREGDRPRGEREGDFRREGDRPAFPPRVREGEGPFPRGVRGFDREGEGRREGDMRRDAFPPRGDRPAPQGELLQLIRELQQEVRKLREEVRDIREERGAGEGREARVRGEREREYREDREAEVREREERREVEIRPDREPDFEERERDFDRREREERREVEEEEREIEAREREERREGEERRETEERDGDREE